MSSSRHNYTHIPRQPRHASSGLIYSSGRSPTSPSYGYAGPGSLRSEYASNSYQQTAPSTSHAGASGPVVQFSALQQQHGYTMYRNPMLNTSHAARRVGPIEPRTAMPSWRVDWRGGENTIPIFLLDGSVGLCMAYFVASDYDVSQVIDAGRLEPSVHVDLHCQLDVSARTVWWQVTLRLTNYPSFLFSSGSATIPNSVLQRWAPISRAETRIHAGI